MRGSGRQPAAVPSLPSCHAGATGSMIVMRTFGASAALPQFGLTPGRVLETMRGRAKPKKDA